MYGQPLDPKKTTFAVTQDPDYDEDRPTLFLADLDDDDNDDVREISHPDFDILWSNDCENIFSSNDQFYVSKSRKHGLMALNTVEEARQWCLSVGMTEDTDLAHTVGG